MSRTETLPQEVRDLLSAYCDRTATPEQIARLESLLAALPGGHRLLLDYLQLEADLRLMIHGDRAIARSLDAIFASADPARGRDPIAPATVIRPLGAGSDRQGEQDHGAAASRAAPDEPPAKSPVLGFLGGVVDYVSHSRRLMLLLIVAMLGGWFVFQIGSVLLGRWWAGDAQLANEPGAPDSGPKPQRGLAAGPAHGKALAWLSGSLGGRWQVVAANSPPHGPAGGVYWDIGTEFIAGQQVDLVAGLGEITFRSGATLVVSAPARFSITSAFGTDLQVGKLSARVPHDATGFTIITPAGSVVDLGTEFGVEVTPDHKLDVQVYVGEVKVDSFAPGGSNQVVGPAVHVTAGKTIHVEPGQPASVVESPDENRFQRDLKLESDSRDKALAAYLDVMRRLKPAIWYRMEGKADDRTIHDETGGGHDAKLYWDGPGNPFVDGRVGHGLWLRGEALKDGVVVPDYPKCKNGRLSVVAWAYAESRPKMATIVANWGSEHMGQFVFQLAGEVAGHADDYCVEVAQTDGSGAIAHEGIGHPFPLHQWVHVAFTLDGKMLRLYRQGREVAVAKVTAFQTESPVRPLGIGVRPTDSGDPQRFFWDGEIDEVALFNETLSADDIQKLANAPPR